MSLVTTRNPGSPGINSFSPAQLLRTARLFASAPELRGLLDPDPDERQWAVLESTPYLQVWLVAWPAGTDTGWHDHGGCSGALVTVEGRLREQTWSAGTDRLLTEGDGLSFGSRRVHHVANVGLGTALSVHAYGPRPAGVNRYTWTSEGLQEKVAGSQGSLR